jgi:hypothetical protein
LSRYVRDRAEYETGSKWFADWHREQPDDTAGMIDLDGVGFCRGCYLPLYLVEATRSRSRKTATVTENLGKLAGLEVFVFYAPDDKHPDEFYIDWRSRGSGEYMTPDRAWGLLVSVRHTHSAVCTKQEKGIW